METIIQFVCGIIETKEYGTATTIIIFLIAIYATFNKIKYKCLEKVSNFVAEVEKNKDMTGEQKFEMCKVWLANEMKVTNSIFMNKLVDKLIQLAYTSSKSYAINYIARKANVEPDKVQEVMNMLKNNTEEK